MINVLHLKKISIVLFLSITLFGCLSRESNVANIGSGGIVGVYHPTGGAICYLVNKSSKRTGIHCHVEPTDGSIFNINAIRAGDLQMGIVQSDWQYHAYHGTSKFKKIGAFKDLRAIFSVHAETFTVVARKDANIKSLDDLKGKRVNIGNSGSGQRSTTEVIMSAKGWDKSIFSKVLELKADKQSKALCDNKIDAMIYVAGHPSTSIREVTTTCDSNFVSITGAEVDKLITENDFYRTTKILGGMYAGNPDDIKTFGVGATLVSSSKVSEKVIYNIVKGVFDNFEYFKKLHPAFAHLKEKQMISDSLSAPLHRGAAKYYKERGWFE